jgi:Flp pilus assembly pilin Flp
LPEIVRWLVEHRPVGGEEGQGLAEYALILSLIAIVAILSLIFLGDSINALMEHIGSVVGENRP